MAAADMIKDLASLLLRDEFGDLDRQVHGIASASAESTAYLEMEVRALGERIARVEEGVSALRAAADRRTGKQR